MRSRQKKKILAELEFLKISCNVCLNVKYAYYNTYYIINEENAYNLMLEHKLMVFDRKPKTANFCF